MLSAQDDHSVLADIEMIDENRKVEWTIEEDSVTNFGINRDNKLFSNFSSMLIQKMTNESLTFHYH